MVAVIPRWQWAGSVCSIHSSPKEGLQVHAQSAAAPREPWAGQLCWIEHFLQWSWKGMWTGRIALETIPPSQAEGKHYLERFILQAANPCQCKSSLWDWVAYKQGFKRPFDCCFKKKNKEKKKMKKELWFHSPVCFDCRLEIPGLPVPAPHAGRIFRFHPAPDALTDGSERLRTVFNFRCARRRVLPMGQQCRAGMLCPWIATEPCATSRVTALGLCQGFVAARCVCC